MVNDPFALFTFVILFNFTLLKDYRGKHEL